ncbi:MAG: nucleotidyltransferase domain-containing protein [Clostridiales bacterium]|jgi:predicted nucleotidyltransferase|nr:nucleotidyltransferase domain-containing protein [Clostridiales bacterium]
MCDFGISKEVLDSVINIITQNPRVLRAVIFGSRAKGNYKKYSDIDLALFGITQPEAEDISEILNNLDVIYNFDVRSYDDIQNEELRRHIDRRGKTIRSKN